MSEQDENIEDATGKRKRRDRVKTREKMQDKKIA